MIRLKTKTAYNDFWGCDLITTYAKDDETGKLYKIRRNDGELFDEAKDLPNEMRVAKGLEPYLYQLTDILIEDIYL